MNARRETADVLAFLLRPVLTIVAMVVAVVVVAPIRPFAEERGRKHQIAVRGLEEVLHDGSRRTFFEAHPTRGEHFLGHLAARGQNVSQLTKLK